MWVRFLLPLLKLVSRCSLFLFVFSIYIYAYIQRTGSDLIRRHKFASYRKVWLLFMKKAALLLTALGLALGLMTGCGKSTPLLTATDYELDSETNTTSRGVTIGDTSEAFLAAYGDNRIFTSVDGGSYEVLPAEEIPFDASVTTLLPTFFINGLPVDPDVFCEENEIRKADLLSCLSSEDFLNSHTVVYYYLLFTWENGSITDILCRYMDYNEDASYYKDFSPADQYSEYE